MTSTIFIRTYSNDLPWFRWCIASLAKFWAEDSKILVSCEPGDVAEVQGVLSQYVHDRPSEVQPWVQWGNDKGYYFQQWQKLTADQLTDSDAIVFFDSDLLLNRTCSLADFMSPDHKRLRWFYEPYSSVETSEPGAMSWRLPTWRAMGVRPEYEFMRRHPFIVWRETLANCRTYLESLHGPLADWLLNLPGHGTEPIFSEFNCLGFYAWLHDQDRYLFLDVNTQKTAGDKYWSLGCQITENPVDQFHSWTGDPHQAEGRYFQAIERNDYLVKVAKEKEAHAREIAQQQLLDQRVMKATEERRFVPLSREEIARATAGIPSPIINSIDVSGMLKVLEEVKNDNEAVNPDTDVASKPD